MDAVIDLALDKPTELSSVPAWASQSVWANTSMVADDYGFHTESEPNPWWSVDLQTIGSIETIAIVNREHCNRRFVYFQILSSLDGESWTGRYIKLDDDSVSSDVERPWMAQFGAPFTARYIKIVLNRRDYLHLRRVQVFGHPASVHNGVDYREMIAKIVAATKARSYFEVGTSAGDSMRALPCDVVSVDPQFQISSNVIGSKKHLFFFQSTSDAFFKTENLHKYFPHGPDISFLDGLHHAEVLLRDFINTEELCHADSIVLMHDCLPLNARMAEREYRIDPLEDQTTRGFWTGDVWKVPLTLKKFRPDLTIRSADCPPTGLMIISGLNPKSRILHDHYPEIIKDYPDTSFNLNEIWSAFPPMSTRHMSPETLVGLYGTRL